MHGRLLAFVALAALVAPAASATHTTGGSGAASSWIDATITIDIAPDLATYGLTVRLEAHKVDGASAGSLRAAYQASGANAAAIRGAVATIDASYNATLASLFPGATRTANATTLDAATFTTGSTASSSYSPPVAFVKTGRVVRPASDLGAAYTAAQVDAVLAAGARVTTEQSFRAEAGWKSVYTLRLPAGLAWTSYDAPGTVSGDGRSATVTVDAVDDASGRTIGGSPKLRGTIGKSGVVPATAADERVNATIALASFSTATSGLPVFTTAVADVHAVSTAARFPGALPTRVALPYVTASGIRALHAAGVLGDDDLAAGAASIRSDVKSRLDAAFGGNASVTARVEPSTLAAGATGPVRFVAFANTTDDLGGAKPRVVDAVLKSGAVLRLNVTLTAVPDARTTYHVRLPTDLAFAGVAGGAKVGDQHATVSLGGPGGAASSAVAFRIRGAGIAPPTAEDVRVAVRVDLKELETSLGGIAGGDLGSLLVDLEVALRLAAVEVPAEVKGTIPSSVEVRYLTADTLRALRAAGALDDATIANLELRFLTEASKNLESLASGVAMKGGVDRATLAAGPDPVTLRAKASLRMFLDGRTPQPLAAMVLHEVEQTFDLAGVDGRETAYEVLFPKGLALTKLAAPGATSETKEADGRSVAFVTVPPGQTTKVTASLGVTPALLWHQFPALVLAAGAVLVALVALPTWGIVRLLRR